MKSSWQTTVSGAMAAVGTAIMNMPPDANLPWLHSIGSIFSVVGIAWMGTAARDNKVSSEDVGAKPQ